MRGLNDSTFIDPAVCLTGYRFPGWTDEVQAQYKKVAEGEGRHPSATEHSLFGVENSQALPVLV